MAMQSGSNPSAASAPPDEPDLLLDILFSGALAGLVSAVVAGGAARAEGRAALQPLNATSHWLHGRGAGRVRRADLAHTGVGAATHVASALFWAVPYGLWLRRRPDRSAGEMLAGGAATAALAAAVDYLAMPRRLTPGWELALDRKGVGATFAGMALGLAAGALLARSLPAAAPAVDRSYPARNDAAVAVPARGTFSHDAS
jgi:hypothetical protein